MDITYMTLDEYIIREIRLVRQERKPNAISVRFVQLHEQASRDVVEEDEYQVLSGLMHSRWRWFQASVEASMKAHDRKNQQGAQE
ncbi:hypothetical protein [Undibacterium sp. TJN19]|uniref:hypothetical protein n=1 Tax=Undibacterium sp. TJN19 TaxID=3413055 RepID=UPI003BEFE524